MEHFISKPHHRTGLIYKSISEISAREKTRVLYFQEIIDDFYTKNTGLKKLLVSWRAYL